jgi:transcriptional regulator with XRE-family HTH domain
VTKQHSDMAAPRAKYQTALGGLTRKEVAAILQVSPQRVQQIETAALRKLRDAFPDLHILCEDASRLDTSIYNVAP